MVEEMEKKQLSLEETEKATLKAETNTGGEKVEELEEGEIVGADATTGDETASLKFNVELALKHPLEHSWTFWFDPHVTNNPDAWGTSMRSIYTFSTIEDFWSVYNNIHHPSKLAVKADFHCFKNKIEPKWEDPICANGGAWTTSFSRGKSDTSWLNTLLAMIGEQFDHGDEICGAVVNVRQRQERIAIWTKNAANETAQISIGRQWKEFLDYNDQIGFIFHDDAKTQRTPKNRYTL